MQLAIKYKSIGLDVVIHPTALIKRPELVRIRDHVAIDPFFYMTTAAEIGNYVHISSHVSIIGGAKAKLIVKDFATIATGCRLICGSDDYANGSGLIGPFIPRRYQSRQKIEPIILEKHSALGTNVVVLPGVVIGEGAVVGAGAVVTKSVPPWTVNVGIPARSIKKRPKKIILKYEEFIKEKNLSNHKS